MEGTTWGGGETRSRSGGLRATVDMSEAIKRQYINNKKKRETIYWNDGEDRLGNHKTLPSTPSCSPY